MSNVKKIFIDKILNIPYKEANVMEFTAAKLNDYHSMVFPESTSRTKLVKELKKDTFEGNPCYNVLGKLTIAGKAKRQQELKKYKLPENASIKEFFEKQFKDRIKASSDFLREIADEIYGEKKGK